MYELLGAFGIMRTYCWLLFRPLQQVDIRSMGWSMGEIVCFWSNIASDAKVSAFCLSYSYTVLKL